MQNRPGESDWVRLENPRTEKFVQFGRGPNICLDLPLTTLSESETKRALEIFRNHGISSAKADGEHEVLMLNFGSDTKTAAATAVVIFNHVYDHRLPSFRIVESGIPAEAGDLPIWRPTSKAISVDAIDGYVRCPTCGFKFRISDPNAVVDNILQRCKQPLLIHS